MDSTTSVAFPEVVPQPSTCFQTKKQDVVVAALSMYDSANKEGGTAATILEAPMQFLVATLLLKKYPSESDVVVLNDDKR